MNLESHYLGKAADEAQACFEVKDDLGRTFKPLPTFTEAMRALRNALEPFLKEIRPLQQAEGKNNKGDVTELVKELDQETAQFEQDIDQFRNSAQEAAKQRKAAPATNTALIKLTKAFEPMSEQSRDLIKQTDLIYKLVARLIDYCEKECNAKESDAWVSRDITRTRKAADEARGLAVEQLKQVRYFWKQAHWLTERFPNAKLRDVEGLVKLVDGKEIEANDWSLTPGRYVGVAPEEVDENFDFEETLREIHVELEDLNAEAITLAATIKKNFEELGV